MEHGALNAADVAGLYHEQQPTKSVATADDTTIPTPMLVSTPINVGRWVSQSGSSLAEAVIGVPGMARSGAAIDRGDAFAARIIHES